MTILWRARRGNVTDVIAGLPRGRDLAYTSVSTILRILESKGVIAARKEGRGHVYVPLLGKADYEARAVRDVVERVFQGVPVALVRQLLDTNEMTDTTCAKCASCSAAPRGGNDAGVRAVRVRALNVALAVGGSACWRWSHCGAASARAQLLSMHYWIAAGLAASALLSAASRPGILESERQHLVVAGFPAVRRPPRGPPAAT